jgi:hypothetical protein
MRGQANLLALAAALVVVTAATSIALLIAGGATDARTGDPEEAALASGITDRLLAADGPLARSDGTLNTTLIERFDGDDLQALLPADSDAVVRVRLGDRIIASTGDTPEGTQVTSLVRVVQYQPVTRYPDLVANDSQSSRYVLRAAGWINVSINESAGTVHTVWVDDRMVLHDLNGINGTHRISIASDGEYDVRFGATHVDEEIVRLRTVRREALVSRLVVTVDA